MTPQPALSPDGAVAPVRRNRRYLLWIAVAAAAGIVVYLWQSRIPPIEAVTVRPAVVESGPPWLGGAITEEIVDALRPVTKQTAEPPFTAVLETRIAGGRVTAQLSRGDGRRYWTRTFDGPLPEIALDIAAAIAPAARKKAPRHKPSAVAYERYLEARQALAHGEYPRAVAGFEAAAQSDAAFALASARLAIAAESLVEHGAARPNELMPGARDAAERAVTLDPELAETHLALGVVRLQYDWDWDAARRELDRALALDPRHPLVARWSERWQAAMNRAPAPPIDVPNVPRDPDSARRLLAQADELRAQAYVTPLTFALAANIAHDTDSLFQWLDVAYDERCVDLPYLVRDPALPRSDPRMLDLIRRLKLP